MDPVEQAQTEAADTPSATESVAPASGDGAPGDAQDAAPLQEDGADEMAVPGEDAVDVGALPATTEVATNDASGFAPGAIELAGGGVLAVFLLALVGFFASRQLRAPATLETVPVAQDADGSTDVAPEPPVTAPPPSPLVEEGLVARFRSALGRSRAALQERFDQILGGTSVDDAVFDDLEVALLSADVGMPTTLRLLEPLKAQVRDGETDPAVLRAALRTQIQGLLSGLDGALCLPEPPGPGVILVVGVNGSGKTTTIGKLAARLVGDGHKVMLAAGDTYRAAAAEQLEVWAKRASADIVTAKQGADPGAVVYDALKAAKARGHDVVIVDTAGRLQTRKPLMEQLTKIRRVIAKQVPDGPHETLLVLDGTMGQNGLSQARLFHDATPLTGVVVTKLDGTAKGGMILTIAAELELPVKMVGIGEKVDDLQPFDAEAFAAALA